MHYICMSHCIFTHIHLACFLDNCHTFYHHHSIEASFMMMNQVDSSSFDDDKDDDKKLKRMISKLSQQVQDQD